MHTNNNSLVFTGKTHREFPDAFYDELGVVNKILPQDKLMDRACELVEQLAKQSTF